MLTTMLSDLEDVATANSWMDGALCAQTDPEAFFPPDEAGPGWWVGAVRVCAKCPVRQECAEYARRHEMPYGVWGGARVAAGSEGAESPYGSAAEIG